MLPSARPALRRRGHHGRGRSAAAAQADGAQASNSMLVVSHNIDGVTDTKLHALFDYMGHWGVDAMLLQETQIAEFPAFAFNHGYDILHSPPLRGKSGGCATLIRAGLSARQLHTLPLEGDVCWTTFKSTGISYVMANCYIRNTETADSFAEIAAALTERLRSMQTASSRILIAGDVNVDKQRASDAQKYESLELLLVDSSLCRVDDKGSLLDTPTHCPYQAGGEPRHLDNDACC